MKEQLEEIRRRALAELSDSATAQTIEAVRVRVLGRSGELTEIMRGLRDLAPSERPLIGKLVNEIKHEVESLIEALQSNLRGRELERSLGEAKLDVTLPGMKIPRGSIHPVTQMIEEMLDVLCEMGFEVEYTQDVEDDFHNFAALNFAPDHPARDMLDTFFLPAGLLLRTHTSNGQIRVLERRRPPLAVVCPGGCYRRDDPSVRASPNFNQIEGFMIDRHGRITMSHLKGVLTEFAKGFYGDTAVRFRGSFFPFTEPSAELDIHCLLCAGAGCPVCKYSGWTEVLGCGMIHPNVLRAVKLDPAEYQGFAFGMGVERTALMKLGINDMRLFFENDLRFLAQFPSVSGGVR
jgi:phenylalanyl-tRNA synthetase alpha chain